MSTKPVAAIVGILVLMLAVLVSIPILDSVQSASGPEKLSDERSSPLIKIDQAVSFQDTSLFVGEINQVYRVNDSTGGALELRAASDSSYQSNQDVTFAGDESFSVSVWAEFNDSYGTTNGTVYSLNGRVILQYDNTSGNWSAWYYNESDTNSYRVNVSQTSQPDTLQNIIVINNGTHFSIYRNNTQGDVAKLGVASQKDPILQASNWGGRQEELRGYDDALNSSERQSLIDNPVRPLNGANRTLRVMFDQGQGTTEPLYFTPATLSLSNISWTSGHPGNILTEDTLLTSGDYKLNTDDGEITAVSGGALDRAPTAFVYYEFRSNAETGRLADGVADSLALFAVVPVVIIAGLIIGVVSRFGA